MSVNSLSNKASVSAPTKDASEDVKAKLSSLLRDLKTVNRKIRVLEEKLHSKVLTNTADAIQTPDALRSEAKRLKGEITYWQRVLDAHSTEVKSAPAPKAKEKIGGESGDQLAAGSNKRKAAPAELSKLQLEPPAKRQKTSAEKKGEASFNNGFASLKEFKLGADGQLVAQPSKNTNEPV